jgi:hypothetical protein
MDEAARQLVARIEKRIERAVRSTKKRKWIHPFDGRTRLAKLLKGDLKRRLDALVKSGVLEKPAKDRAKRP